MTSDSTTDINGIGTAFTKKIPATRKLTYSPLRA